MNININGKKMLEVLAKNNVLKPLVWGSILIGLGVVASMVITAIAPNGLV